jgi:hypothetical protein
MESRDRYLQSDFPEAHDNKRAKVEKPVTKYQVAQVQIEQIQTTQVQIEPIQTVQVRKKTIQTAQVPVDPQFTSHQFRPR